MVLVANKVDLVHLRKVSSDQGQEMAAKHSVSLEPFHNHLTSLSDLCINQVFDSIYLCVFATENWDNGSISITTIIRKFIVHKCISS